jgi:cytochrome c oxidase assembly protein subunit 15
LSLALVALSTLLVLRVRGDEPSAASSPLVLAVYGVTWVAVYLGTIVTGAGPHAGDLESPRNGLDPQVMSHVHAASVYVLVALTVLCAWRSSGAVRSAALGQGLIGFVQYFTDLPIALVATHLVGAAVLVAAATRLLLVPVHAPATADRVGADS